ncbi:MAG: SAM-dependent chlorinase/fluorinase [Planctomycetaceae bacterium]|nr:SAM-dependent chlorinase/fluorinase [Planctomycetaceae bacterium]
MAKASGVVALLTDYGLQDAYTGILKGALLSVNPAARIVDLTHDIPPQDIREAGRVLSAARGYFPAGTVFVSVVDPGVGSDRAILGVETDRHYFLAPDNGLLGFLDRTGRIRRIVRLTEARYFLKPVSRTFHGRDIFAPVAGHLSKGVDLGRFGPGIGRMTVAEPRAPRRRPGGAVEGEVVSIDRFGNLITNIPGDLLPDARHVRITVGRRVVRALSGSYADAKKGELLALVGSTGHLEISVNQGSAMGKTRIRKGAPVQVTRS